MKIYIETILVLNFLLDFMILYGTKKLLKNEANNFRLILASMIGSLTTILVKIKVSNILLIIIKISLSLIMNITAFGRKNILKNTFYFYLISIIIGGIMYLFDFNKSYYMNFILLITISPITIYVIIKEINHHKLDINNKYHVKIKYHNKIYKLEGFIDTGNRLKSPISNKGVILVNLKINIENVIYIPYKALNSEGIIPCIKPDNIWINNKEIHNYLIGIAKNRFYVGKYNCILPNKLKEEIN